ncbi:hypothetical protein BKA66DRAFT_437816 [Pyrenochaeta sp. MPI-SDFR-AT-0127]|nr:hypothetical protein BKA66DRAFT_437816 [Pyrenochaeta sp. MPI-SDFR-AT-0127]
MPNSYQIIVENQSGRPQSYALVNQAPEYVGTGGPKIWSNVVSDSTLEPDDSTNFEISTQYRAFFGTSRGKLGERVSIQVAGSVPVTLGQQNNDGTVLLGTTVKLIAGPGGLCHHSPEARILQMAPLIALRFSPIIIIETKPFKGIGLWVLPEILAIAKVLLSQRSLQNQVKVSKFGLRTRGGLSQVDLRQVTSWITPMLA